MSLKGNIKVLGVALAAMLALSALVASAAQANGAPHWTVEASGETLGAGQTRFLHAQSKGADVSLTLKSGIKLTTNGGGTTGECTAHGKIVGSGAGAPGTVKEVTLTCTNVDVYETAGNKNLTPNCTVHSPGKANGIVNTNDLEGTLVWMEATGDKKVGLTLVPEANTTTGSFVTIEITGAACAAAQKANVTGEVIGTVESATTVDLTEGLLDFPDPPDLKSWNNETPRKEITSPGLKLGAVEAKFDGTFEVTVGTSSELPKNCELFGIEPA